MRNSGIYKIDFPNGKVYIGLTCDLKRRIKEHNTDSLSSLLPVHKAIKKYGRIKIGE